ncbi:MAG: hypothetical protein JXR62_05560 [Bacilli bacterium]|nr:hypothetical protein [Bacilli bacterium]
MSKQKAKIDVIDFEFSTNEVLDFLSDFEDKKLNQNNKDIIKKKIHELIVHGSIALESLQN